MMYMGFTCGFVGLPNVGKSTLFNIITQSKAKVGNFPFCTIRSSSSNVTVPDSRTKKLAEIVKTDRIIPATIEFVDTSGLIQGASKGEGLGNQFLSDIRTIEMIGHIVRCFKKNEIFHVLNRINPREDINIINDELILSDLEICERAIFQIEKYNKKNNEFNRIKKLSVLKKCFAHLSKFCSLRTLNLLKEEKILIKDFNFLTIKPTMYIANIDSNQFNNNGFLEEIHAIARSDGSIVLPICAILNNDKDTILKNTDIEYTKNLDFQRSCLNNIIKFSYKLLNLQTYFTVGVKEVRAWTISIGDTAKQAARKIHTDFEKGFIKAKVISFSDFINYNGEHGAKKAGKVRLEGKDYIVQDGDIIDFLFNI